MPLFTSRQGHKNIFVFFPYHFNFLSDTLMVLSWHTDINDQIQHNLLLPYFFAYKTVFFSFQNNPKKLDPSYKMDLDLWDCLGRVKPVLQQNCVGLIWLFVLILERESPVL